MSETPAFLSINVEGAYRSHQGVPDARWDARHGLQARAIRRAQLATAAGPRSVDVGLLQILNSPAGPGQQLIYRLPSSLLGGHARESLPPGAMLAPTPG